MGVRWIDGPEPTGGPPRGFRAAAVTALSALRRRPGPSLRRSQRLWAAQLGTAQRARQGAGLRAPLACLLLGELAAHLGLRSPLLGLCDLVDLPEGVVV